MKRYLCFAALLVIFFANTSRAEELEQLFLGISDAGIQDAERLGVPSSSVLEVWRVELNEAALTENRIQSVQLPKDTDYEDSNSYRVFDGDLQGGVWWASLINLEKHQAIGSISLTLPSEDGEASGSIVTAERYFEIIQTASGSYLVELSPRSRDRIVEYATYSIRQPPSGWMPLEDCKSVLCTGSLIEIDVAIYYSEAVEKSYGAGNVQGAIKDLVDSANRALRSSFVCVSLNAKLIHPWSGFKVDGSALHASLGKLISNYQTLLVDKADLALLLIKANECGLAHQFPVHKAAWALASVDKPAQGNKWTCGLSPKQVFVHEIGHLLGADHDGEITHPDYAHAFVSSTGRAKTIMVEEVESKPFQFSRPPKFGCPKVNSKCNEPSNNACVIRQVAPIIATYHHP